MYLKIFTLEQRVTELEQYAKKRGPGDNMTRHKSYASGAAVLDSADDATQDKQKRINVLLKKKKKNEPTLINYEVNAHKKLTNHLQFYNPI